MVYSFEAETESHVLITLEDLLAFITGASQLPPLGFEHNPTVIFQDGGKYPISSTCSPSISLPDVEDYHLFKELMVEGLIGGIGFGRV